MIRLRAKALSLKQPWASMIADGEKTIETRKWRTSYRGPLFICSSKRPVGEGPVGVVLAVARLVDCRRFTRADVPAAQCEWYDGYGLHLGDVRRIRPIPVRGSLKLFDLALNVEFLEVGPVPADTSAQCLFCEKPAEVEDVVPKELLSRHRDFVFYRCREHRRGQQQRAIDMATRLCEVPA